MDVLRRVGRVFGRGERSESGVTLVELLLVALLILILAKMLTPRYTKLAILKHQVYSTAHDLAADLRYTRRLTIGGGTTGNSGSTYWLKVYKVGSATDTWRILDNGVEADPLKATTVLDGVQLQESATDSFYFDSNGVPFPVGGGSIEVRDANSMYRWNVSVVKGTGRVQLIEL